MGVNYGATRCASRRRCRWAPSCAWAAPLPNPAAPANASAIASRISQLESEVVALEGRLARLRDDLGLAQARVAEASKRLGSSQRSSSALVAAARRQAMAAYIHADPALQPFAIAAAVSQGDVNDVAWSLGLLKASQRQTLELARRAKTFGGAADGDLVAALDARAALELELARLEPALASVRGEAESADLALKGFVSSQGPTTMEGLSTVAYGAYRRSEDLLTAEQPACGLRWELLAAIGKTESNHGWGRLDSLGNTSPPIIGIPIGPDTDRGELDRNPLRDHAVGPMQFIPSTWRRWAADGNGDGIFSIDNIYDQSVAAGRYLCAAAGNLTLKTQEGTVRAILAYNPNLEYLRVVGARFEALASDVAGGWFSVANLPEPPPVDPSLFPPAGDGTPPTTAPGTPPPPSPTQVQLLALVSELGPGVAVDPIPLPGTCDDASAALAGRAGFVQCTAVEAGIPLRFDPCQVAPFDPTLAVCLPEADGLGRLVRLPIAGVAPPQPAAGPPFLLLVLEGGDRCRPEGRAVAPAPGASWSVHGQLRSSTTTTRRPPTRPPPRHRPTRPPPRHPPTRPPRLRPPTRPPPRRPPTRPPRQHPPTRPPPRRRRFPRARRRPPPRRRPSCSTSPTATAAPAAPW
jgi:membrane-bound lytic murein transglycosylase B